MPVLLPRLWLAVAAALAAAAVLFAACDTAPGPAPLDRMPPEVADLVVAPDTIRIADLPPDRIANGQATVDIVTAVTAHDPDGTIDRVLVLIAPSYGTSPTGVVRLPRGESGDGFGGALRYAVAADRPDVLMVRAFAVDNDSLTSNQLVAQIRVLPDTTNGAD